jgi:hypothetical protein
MNFRMQYELPDLGPHLSGAEGNRKDLSPETDGI